MINKLNSKDSLSHWDVATEFTGEQVTALALGKDPVHETEISIKGMPLYQRLERSYNAVRRWHALDADAEPNWDQIGVASEKELLHSIGVVQAMTHFDPDDAENRSRWLASDEHCGFSSQRFAREEVARWLSACGIHSAYKFAGSKFTESELLPQSVRNTLLKMIIGMAISRLLKYPAQTSDTSRRPSNFHSAFLHREFPALSRLISSL